MITTAAILWRNFGDPLHSAARREWKDQAIATIQAKLANKPNFDKDLTTLKNAMISRPNGTEWIGEELLLMRNGEWMLCENICQKSESRIPDIFIGYGSDGKWYYSTFHFCVGKCVLEMETQPNSLKEFVDGYWLVEFDGKSDECLKQTWDNGAWGSEKTQGATTSP